MIRLSASVVAHDQAIGGAIRVDLALAPFAHGQPVRAGPAAHARTAKGIHATGQTIGIADAWIAGIHDRKLADSLHAPACSARIEDRTLLVGLATLVATLTETALVPWLTVCDGHDANAIHAALVDAGIVVLLAAAIPVGLADSPARSVDARFTLVAAAAGILRVSAADGTQADEHGGHRAHPPSRHASGERNGKAVKVIRVHSANSA